MKWCLAPAMVIVLLGCGGGGDVTSTLQPDTGAGGPTKGPNACDDKAPCASGSQCSGGVCVLAPAAEAKLTDNRTDEAVAGAPNLDCVDVPLAAPAGPATTTAYGIVDRFGGGRKTIGIEVSIFKASEWPPAECTAKPIEEQKECFRTLPSPLKAISTDPSAGSPALPQTCVEHLDCPPGHECTTLDNKISYHCEPQFGLYEIPDVPTNTLLVIRSRNIEPTYESKWHDTYVYNSYLYADKVKEGRYRVNALMVSDGQWITVPSTLSVKGGIKKTHSAVGGRIRDCRTDARPGFTIGEAAVALETPGSATGYFNDDEDDTVPIANRTATDIFGRFAIVDVVPGKNRIAAAARVGAAVTTLGAEDLYIVPDALIVVAFPGKEAILKK